MGIHHLWLSFMFCRVFDTINDVKKCTTNMLKPIKINTHTLNLILLLLSKMFVYIFDTNSIAENMILRMFYRYSVNTNINC